MAGVSDPFPDGIEGRLDEDRIAAVRDFLDANLRLKRWAAAREEELPETAALMAASPDTGPLLERVERVVDDGGGVRAEASGRLARLRDTLSSVGARIDSILRQVVAPQRSALSDGGVHRRAGRPVLAVRSGRGASAVSCTTVRSRGSRSSSSPRRSSSSATGSRGPSRRAASRAHPDRALAGRWSSARWSTERRCGWARGGPRGARYAAAVGATRAPAGR